MAISEQNSLKLYRLANQPLLPTNKLEHTYSALNLIKKPLNIIQLIIICDYVVIIIRRPRPDEERISRGMSKSYKAWQGIL